MTIYIAQTFYEELGSPSSTPVGTIFVFDSEQNRDEFVDKWVSKKEEYCLRENSDEIDYLFYNQDYKYWLEFDETELNSITRL